MDDEVYHVYPESEEGHHVLVGLTCPCRPSRDENDEAVIHHNRAN